MQYVSGFMPVGSVPCLFISGAFESDDMPVSLVREASIYNVTIVSGKISLVKDDKRKSGEMVRWTGITLIPSSFLICP